MKMSRWLLPFTHGVDMSAIEYAVRLAANADATLVPVSLISAPSRGARLEHIQQSKDFLEAVQYKAERLQVPLERDEVFTTDVQQCLVKLVREKHCNGIVLVTGGGQTRLLQDHEVKHLLIEPPAPLVIIRLSAPAGWQRGQVCGSGSLSGYVGSTGSEKVYNRRRRRRMSKNRS